MKIEEIKKRWAKVRDSISPNFSLKQAKDDIFTLLCKIDKCNDQIQDLKESILLRKNNESYIAQEIKAVFKKYDTIYF